MGMYDEVKVKLKLPGYDGVTTDTFQTKHFDCLIETYVIKENGDIYKQMSHCEIVDGDIVQSETGSVRMYLTNLNETVIFYNDRYVYHADFTNGRLGKIAVSNWVTFNEAI